MPWKFFCTTGHQSGFWTNLPVPACWELHGFGTLNYHRDATNPPPEEGRYEHTFHVPAAWSGRRVFLVFEGVMTDAHARLNGQSLEPAHQGAYYRFKYEVTTRLNFGADNKLEVSVDKHSANASVNNAERKGDFWMYGGIFRPVYLEAVPAQFLERVAVDARADGALVADVFVNGAGNADSLTAQINSLDGKKIGAPFAGKISGDEVSLATRIAAPRLWTAETPNLYSVQVRLQHGEKILHQIEQRFGFRTFEVRDHDGLYLNGQRVILKGCNRHSFWPDSGRCLSPAIQRLDVETMKDMNMNAVRMSHYPPDTEFLDCCDELGLYVLDELAGWHGNYDTETGTQRVREMVTRDVNHPAILFWDNGNEGGFNTNLDALFPELDPQHRRVLHPWAPFGGVNTAHYLTYAEAAVACTGVPMRYYKGAVYAGTNDPNKYIYMPTEFQHGLYDGGAGAGLDDLWRLMQTSPLLGGGFIWAFLDEGVKRVDTGQIDVSGNEAPDGIVGPYREREASFYAIKEIWSPIRVMRETNDVFTVENHFNFTDASQCRFTWQLRRFRAPNEPVAGFRILAEGKITAPEIPPGGTSSLKIQLPEAPKRNADALALRVNDPHGRELFTWVWPLRRREIPPSAAGVAGRAEYFGGTNQGVVELKTRDLVVRLDGQTGALLAVVRGGRKFSLNHGPQAAPAEARLKNVAWQLREDGWLQCDYTYTATGTNDFFGVVFDYPENLVKHKRWLGDGPYRVWKNRTQGVTFGDWENDYNNTITGWSGWVYPEFKGCFANVRWLQLQTTEGLITVINNSGVPFLQVLNPELPPPNLVAKTGMKLPPAGLAFLDAIPPVGNKFQEARKGGPHNQLAVAQGDYSGSVSFYFGELPK